MKSEAIIKKFNELEAIAGLLQDKASAFKEYCRKAKEKAAGVSTPASRKGKGLTEKEEAALIAKSRARRFKKSHT